MKAQEAREKALSINTNSVDSQYAKIVKAIRREADLGNYECWIYEPIIQDVRTKLVDDGYGIGKEQFERNESLTKINW